MVTFVRVFCQRTLEDADFRKHKEEKILPVIDQDVTEVSFDLESAEYLLNDALYL